MITLGKELVHPAVARFDLADRLEKQLVRWVEVHGIVLVRTHQRRTLVTDLQPIEEWFRLRSVWGLEGF